VLCEFDTSKDFLNSTNPFRPVSSAGRTRLKTLDCFPLRGLRRELEFIYYSSNSIPSPPPQKSIYVIQCCVLLLAAMINWAVQRIKYTNCVFMMYCFVDPRMGGCFCLLPSWWFECRVRWRARASPEQIFGFRNFLRRFQIGSDITSAEVCRSLAVKKRNCMFRRQTSCVLCFRLFPGGR